MVAVEAVLDIGGGAEHVVAAVAGIGGVVAVHRAILGLEGVPSRVIHDHAVVADAEVEVAWVVVVVAVAGVVAVVARSLACSIAAVWLFYGACAYGFVIGFA